MPIPWPISPPAARAGPWRGFFYDGQIWPSLDKRVILLLKRTVTDIRHRGRQIHRPSKIRHMCPFWNLSKSERIFRSSAWSPCATRSSARYLSFHPIGRVDCCTKRRRRNFNCAVAASVHRPYSRICPQPGRQGLARGPENLKIPNKHFFQFSLQIKSTAYFSLDSKTGRFGHFLKSRML